MRNQLWNIKEPFRVLLAGVVHVQLASRHKLSSSSTSLGSYVLVLKLTKLSEHEARLDWILFSPAVYVLMFTVFIKKAGHEIAVHAVQWLG